MQTKHLFSIFYWIEMITQSYLVIKRYIRFHLVRKNINTILSCIKNFIVDFQTSSIQISTNLQLCSYSCCSPIEINSSIIWYNLHKHLNVPKIWDLFHLHSQDILHLYAFSFPSFPLFFNAHIHQISYAAICMYKIY